MNGGPETAGTDTVAAVVLTLNEEVNIERCLASLSWCSERVVVDSESKDRTREIASRLGARVYVHRQSPRYQASDQRNWAIDHCELTTEWVLFVDADEVVPPALAQAIAQRCRHDEGFDAFQLTPKYMFWGQWMRRCTGYPSWHDRLVRRGRTRFEGGGAWEHLVPGSRVGRITEPYLHYGNSKGFADWLERHDRYSSWDAGSVIQYLSGGGDTAFGAVRKLGRRRLAARLWPVRPLLRFVHMYVLRGGFLDGPTALVFCIRYAIYEYMVAEKVAEHRRRLAGKPL